VNSPLRRPHPSWLALALWLAGGLGAPAGVGFSIRVERAPGVTDADFARYDHVAVRVLRETASTRASWHHRQERRDMARQAARAFPVRIIAALRTTQTYREVTDAVARRAPTLVVNGVLRTLEEPGDEPRVFLRLGGSSPAVFEATLELSDAGTGRHLGRLRVDRDASLLPGAGAGARSLQQLMEAVAAACADELARLRVPDPAPGGLAAAAGAEPGRESRAAGQPAETRPPATPRPVPCPRGG
jgi:hypothetical protein